MKTTPRKRTVNWKYLPDAITEEEVNLQLRWTADERTSRAIQRQSELMGFESGTDYLLQVIAATLAGNEEDTILADDGRILIGHLDQDGLPRNV